jgi:arylsulfatase A-like enzyme
MWEHELFVKFNMYEGSVHVPILIDVPGQGPAVRTELVEHIDLFPTICELVGARCPEGVQGRSLLPLLGNGPTPSGWRDAVFSEESRRAIGGNLEMIRTKSMKLNVYNRVPGELYDLREDPGELDNRITDPQYEGTISQLLERLKEWEKTTPQDQTSRTQTTSPRTP